MKLATAIKTWEAVAEWERETLGAARSSLSFPMRGPNVIGDRAEVEIRLNADATWPDEVDLLGLADVAAGHGAGLYLHTTGGLVIR